MISRRGALIAGGTGAVVVAGGAGAAYVVATGDKPEPPSPASVNADGKVLWRNWSGVQHAYPAARLAPRDEGELAAMLKVAQAPIRPVGAGHSFTALAPTNGALVSLDGLSGVVGWEGDAVVVRTGTRLGALGLALAQRGRALPNLPDINKQSLGGALSTATHGTGARIPAMHADVTGLRLVTPSGRVIDADAGTNAEIFQAAKVSLGALGVVTQVRMRTAANRRLRRRVWLEPFDEAVAQAEQRWANHRNFEFFAVPFTGLAANISHDETDDPAEPRGPDQDTELLQALRALRNLLGFSTPLRKAAAKALMSTAKPETAVDEGWKLLSTERPVRFNEMEFHLPVEHQLKALAEVQRAIEAERPDVFFPIEVRRIAGDDAWLSPFQGGPRGSVAVHAYYRDDFSFLYSLIEPIFRRYDGRPHWGKLHTLRAGQLEAIYPNWPDFLAVRRDLDPDGRMLNPYLKGLLGL